MRNSGCNPRIAIAIVVAIISAISYFSMNQTNPVTGQNQHIGITPQQETALGLQAAPEMEQQYGGEDPNSKHQQLVESVGQDIVQHSKAGTGPYHFEFHALADPQTINAFSLPGGPVFITDGLLSKLQTRGELAGVLAHEIGHVIGRHAAEHMAKQQFTQGLTGAAVIASIDPNHPGSSIRNAAIAQMVGQLVDLRYSRADESAADKFGVEFMSEAGYDPRAMIGVMEVLQKNTGSGGVEFFETHPNPQHRIQDLQKEIHDLYPNGVPSGMTP